MGYTCKTRANVLANTMIAIKKLQLRLELEFIYNYLIIELLEMVLLNVSKYYDPLPNLRLPST